MAKVLDPNIRELALSLDLVPENDAQELSGSTDATWVTWRKRGTGPEYVLFGNNYFYPRQALAEFLRGKVRRRGHFTTKDVL
jgi:hypothetical protein